MRISDWSSDVCSSDLRHRPGAAEQSRCACGLPRRRPSAGDAPMNDVLGGPAGAYLGLVVVLIGGAAFLTGQAVATSWKPVWQVVLYGLLLAMAGRFLLFALFDGDLLALPGFALRSEEHTSELQSLMRTSYA